MKLPKFLIGKNKMVSDHEYIVHTRDPVFFAEIITDKWNDYALVPDREIPEGLEKRMKEWHIAFLKFKTT